MIQTNGGMQGASDSSAGKGSRQVKGSSLVLKQFHALLVKRFHHAVRSQKDFIAQVREIHNRAILRCRFGPSSVSTAVVANLLGAH